MRSPIHLLSLLLLAWFFCEALVSARSAERHDILSLFQKMNYDVEEEEATSLATCGTTTLPFLRLGYAYDLIRGDPGFTSNRLLDPGFMSQVFMLDHGTDETKICQGGFRIPLKTSVSFPSNYEEKVVEVTSINKFKQMAFAEVSTSSNTTGYEFSASAGYIHSKERIEKYNQVNIYTIYSRTAYNLAFPDIMANPPTVTPNFQESVRGLDLWWEKNVDKMRNAYLDPSTNRIKLHQFYTSYGTSVIVDITNGVRRVTRRTLGNQIFSLAKSLNITTNSLQSSVYQDAAKAAGIQFSSVENSVSNGATYIGSADNFYGIPDASYFNQLKAGTAPITFARPIKMKLRPITDLMTPQFVPGIAVDRLAIIRQAYESFLRTYVCSVVSGCSF